MNEYDNIDNFIPSDEPTASNNAMPSTCDGAETNASTQLPIGDNTDVEQTETEPNGDNVTPADNPADNEESEQPTPEDEARQRRFKRWDKWINWALIVAIVVLILLNVVKIFIVSDVTIQQNSMQPTYHPDDKVAIYKLGKPQTSDVVVVYKNDVNKLQAYFAPPSEKQSDGKYELLIKRAVAVGGDTIWVTVVPTTAGDRYALAVQKNGNTYYEFYVWDADQGIDNFALANTCARGKYVLCESLDRARELYGDFVVQITMNNVGILGAYTESSPYTLLQDQLLLLGDNRDRSNDSRGMGLFPSTRLLGVVI